MTPGTRAAYTKPSNSTVARTASTNEYTARLQCPSTSTASGAWRHPTRFRNWGEEKENTILE